MLNSVDMYLAGCAVDYLDENKNNFREFRGYIAKAHEHHTTTNHDS